MQYQAAIGFSHVITVIYSLKVGRSLQGECMTTYHDVPADLLIADLAKRFADNDAINAPEWADFVKTGTHRENPPEQSDCSGGFSLWVPVFTKSAHSGALIESLSTNL